MIYVVIAENKLAQANKWIQDNFPGQGVSFVVNKQSTTPPKKNYCVTSFVDNGTVFVEAIKDHFGYTDFVTGYYNSRGIPKANKSEKKSTDPGVGNVDQCDFIAGLVDIGG